MIDEDKLIIEDESELDNSLIDDDKVDNPVVMSIIEETDNSNIEIIDEVDNKSSLTKDL
jgi:hypothetical protein